MRRIYFIVPIIILIFFILYRNLNPEGFAKDWTQGKITQVIEESLTSTDQTSSGKIMVNEHDREIIKILSGKILFPEGDKNIDSVETSNILFGHDTSVSYEIKRRPNGDRLFEAIKINNNYNGWCVSYSRFGKKLNEGTMIDNKRVGKWYYYSKTGNLDSIIDFGKSYQIYLSLR